MPAEARSPGGESRRRGETARAGLAARRRALALTEVQLAALFGCPASFVSAVEDGRSRPGRAWWAYADAMLGARGGLLRLFDGPVPGPVWPAWDDLGELPYVTLTGNPPCR